MSFEGGGRSAGGKIALLEQHDLEPATGRIARDAGAVDAAANNRQIEVGHPSQYLRGADLLATEVTVQPGVVL